MKFLSSILYLILFTSGSVTAEPLDAQSSLRTLFTSSQVRDELDSQRDQGKFKLQQSTSTVIFREPVTVKMQGIVLRENKKPVVFVNDGNTIKSRKVDNEIIVSTKKVSKKAYKVPVRVNQRNVKLKPGQQWNETDRQVEENYRIKPAKEKTSENDETTDKADNLTVKALENIL
ncbi:MAG: hypothetical protein DIZ80_10205 [endosymbiont of Galathealinum brachiosum]|uniref:Organic solvent tolerance-like N-terminal domain-containing protein n=1 Tax=endosymbiont of Galathealinum brachiosum TaxID=2200906 RepID=A0A370DE37_9GAMM|nr:MAG: hypothetical protein DIZ80_10205 [endosymbiont of Galathealinum brachiosum]